MANQGFGRGTNRGGDAKIERLKPKIPKFDAPKIESGEVLWVQQGRTQGGGHGGLAPNGCMIVHINNIIVSGEAIVGAKNSGKLFGGRGSAPNPAGDLTALPQTP